ncbi:MAG: hypothetical protein AB2L26_04190 [Ignavibacteria bacterium]
MANKKYYALVHAILHSADESNRGKFYENLDNTWTKVHEHKLSTTWVCELSADSLQHAFDIAQEDFVLQATISDVRIDYIMQIGGREVEIGSNYKK